MLFPYRYITHKIEKMQEFIDYIFYEVWCKAPSHTSYTFDFYNNKPELKEVVIAFHNSKTKWGKFFNRKIEEIFSEFQALSASEISRLKNWYEANNAIEKLCANDPSASPINYKGLTSFNPKLSALIKEFFKNLYSNELLSLKALSSKIGAIDDHYDDFMNVNTKGKCPYCGINDLKGNNHTKREAYDHFIPKGLYPFNSINFENLAPMCNECNSSRKLEKDPLYDKNKNRRKSFYSYKTAPHKIQINLTLNSSDINNLKPGDINISLGPAALSEELQTWNDLFGIEERYKAKCCDVNDGKYWITQIQEECENYGKKPKEFLIGRLKEAEKNPYADVNFLRKPFLEACDALKVFEN